MWRSHRLAVSMMDSESENTGSSPVDFIRVPGDGHLLSVPHVLVGSFRVVFEEQYGPVATRSRILAGACGSGSFQGPCRVQASPCNVLAVGAGAAVSGKSASAARIASGHRHQPEPLGRACNADFHQPQALVRGRIRASAHEATVPCRPAGQRAERAGGGLRCCHCPDRSAPSSGLSIHGPELRKPARSRSPEHAAPPPRTSPDTAGTKRCVAHGRLQRDNQPETEEGDGPVDHLVIDQVVLSRPCGRQESSPRAQSRTPALPGANRTGWPVFRFRPEPVTMMARYRHMRFRRCKVRRSRMHEKAREQHQGRKPHDCAHRNGSLHRRDVPSGGPPDHGRAGACTDCLPSRTELM